MVAPAHARQGLRLNQLDTLSELSLNEDILRAFGESSLAEARPEAREPIQRRGVRSPARLDVRQSHMLFLQPDCDTVVAPLADFRSADGADLPPVQYGDWHVEKHRLACGFTLAGRQPFGTPRWRAASAGVT